MRGQSQQSRIAQIVLCWSSLAGSGDAFDYFLLAKKFGITREAPLLHFEMPSTQVPSWDARLQYLIDTLSKGNTSITLCTELSASKSFLVGTFARGNSGSFKTWDVMTGTRKLFKVWSIAELLLKDMTSASRAQKRKAVQMQASSVVVCSSDDE